MVTTEGRTRCPRSALTPSEPSCSPRSLLGCSPSPIFLRVAEGGAADGSLPTPARGMDVVGGDDGGRQIVDSHRPPESLPGSLLACELGALPEEQTDVLIVGAGIAGLSVAA